MQPSQRVLAVLPLVLAALACMLLPRLIVLQGNLMFGPNDVIDGHALVLSGNIHFAEGSRVRGALLILSANVMVDGQIDGGVHALDGNIMLGPRAQVDGEVAMGNTNFNRAPGARVQGGYGLFGPGMLLLGQAVCLVPFLFTLGVVLIVRQLHRQRRWARA